MGEHIGEWSNTQKQVVEMKWIFWGWDPGVHDLLVVPKMFCRLLLPAESYIFQFK